MVKYLTQESNDCIYFDVSLKNGAFYPFKARLTCPRPVFFSILMQILILLFHLF
uniref:Uncharacterized protein n=1 Tax=Anguilla anguilla TaxID=7936 RepID=A0A0E9X1F8_ANGAN